MAMEAIRSVGVQPSYQAAPVEKVAAPEAGAQVAEQPAPETSAFTQPQDPGKDPAIQEIESEEKVEQDNEKIKKAISDLNKKISSNSEAVFGIHDKTNRITIKIVEKDSKKVIKEFPPDKTLDMIAKVWELAGIMVDEKR
ncbi:MAG: flagellar protein FlaG [Lachnospiraceae bacterium]|nr:flagellar protein FlaG [Lachnospiraceae bacterium]